MKFILAVMKPFKVAELVDAVESNPHFPGITVLKLENNSGVGSLRISSGLWRAFQ